MPDAFTGRRAHRSRPVPAPGHRPSPGPGAVRNGRPVLRRFPEKEAALLEVIILYGAAPSAEFLDRPELCGICGWRSSTAWWGIPGGERPALRAARLVRLFPLLEDRFPHPSRDEDVEVVSLRLTGTRPGCGLGYEIAGGPKRGSRYRGRRETALAPGPRSGRRSGNGRHRSGCIRSVRRQGGVFGHGVFFPSLGMEIMAVAHQCVDRDARGALGFAQGRGMRQYNCPKVAA